MRYVAVLVVLLLLASPVLAVDLLFSWNQTNINEVDGWNIYYTTISGSYIPTDVINVSTVCTDPDGDLDFSCSFAATLPDVPEYYFQYTSFNQWGESVPSAETYFQVQGTPPPPPTATSVQFN